MYARVHNITNIAGRANYVKNKKNREEVVGFYNTANDDFWKLLARENQEQFRRSSNVKRKNAKASEAREVVVGLPAYINDQPSAEVLASQVKNTLGVECMVAIHRKYGRDEQGNKVLNVHAHIIFAERTLLDKPIELEEKRAPRTYYYDAKGKQCKKADAVKVTPKGTITQEAYTRYFSNKKSFYSLNSFKKLEPLLNQFQKQFDLQTFDIEKHFPQYKIGNNNPKEKCIREYNKLVKEMNAYFDKLDSQGSERPAKQIFCEKYAITKRFGVNRADEVRNLFEQFRRTKEQPQEIISKQEIKELQADLIVLKQEEKELTADINKVEFVLQTKPDDFVGNLQARAYRNTIEEKYNFLLDNALLRHLKDKLKEVRQSIAAIVKKLKTVSAVPEQTTPVKTTTEKEQEF